MPCYYPLNAAQIPGSGKKPVIFKKNQPRPSLSPGWEDLQLPCGQCHGCRIDRSKEWAVRIVHESQMHLDNCFVTLTYDEDNLPIDGSLNKEHFQKFMKRLRKHHEGQTIRYFHCGEYGESLSRPHYHACLFGIDFNDRVPFSSSRGIITDYSETLEKIWGKGFCTVGELNYQTAAYTARYIMKKITGEKAQEHYQRPHPKTGELIELQPEYTTMSLGRKRGEGLGASFYEKYKADFFPRDECPVPGRGVYKGVPKYYEQLYAEENPDSHRAIKQARKLYRDQHAEEYLPHRLEAKSKVKRAQISQLKRQL